MRRTMLLTLAALLIVMLARTQAVTDGKLDGNAHPAVVLLLMEVQGKPAFRCSGTLLSATVLLTAGHCTNNFPGSPYTGMRVFTESKVQGGINNYPLAGPNSVEAVSWAAHPLYETAPFFVHDVGVVVLEEPGFVLPASQYGVLPSADQLDSLKNAARSKGCHLYGRRLWAPGEFPDPGDVPGDQHQDPLLGHAALVADQRPGLHRRFLHAAVEQPQYRRDVFW